MKVVLIEDDMDDVELFEDALQSNGVEYNMQVLYDGMSALNYLTSEKTMPSIIVMDFNIPKMHGRELLREIKSMKKYKSTPVVILSTSSAIEDIEYSYRNGADKYLTKPSTLQQFNEMISIITELATTKAESV